MDGKGPISEQGYRPIEHEAPGIVERKSVTVPLETGILSIDSMFPIGRGQRELIIGDRQTGKTSIATDTILNQKGKGVICIYVAIGQKASTIANLVSTLERPRRHGLHHRGVRHRQRHGLPAIHRPLRRAPPWPSTSCTRAETCSSSTTTFPSTRWPTAPCPCCWSGPPAVKPTPATCSTCTPACWSAPGRLNEAYGGGSLTALPIIETQAGDVSAYIPTNVISITDGQIFLETSLFNAGLRPASERGACPCPAWAAPPRPRP